MTSVLESTNELYELLNDKDIIQRTKIQQLRYIVHGLRIDEDKGESRPQDKGDRRCWKNQLREELSFLAITN